MTTRAGGAGRRIPISTRTWAWTGTATAATSNATSRKITLTAAPRVIACSLPLPRLRTGTEPRAPSPSSTGRRGLGVITSLVTPTWTCSGRRARGGPSRPLTRQRFAARGRPVFRALFYRLLRLLHVLDQLVQAPVVVVRDIGPPLAAPELGYDFVDGQFRRFGQQVGNEKLAPAEPSLSTLGP